MQSSGLILAALIAILVAWIWQRTRKKMHFQMKGQHWLAVIIIVFVVLLLFYGGTHTPHTPTK
jgi:heme A synthase